MSVPSLESTGQNKHRGYDNGQYPDAFPDRSPIFLLFAVADQDQADNWPERRDHHFQQPQKCIVHGASLHGRQEHRIDLTSARLFSHVACSMILLASIVVLSVVALTTVAAVKDYERVLAAEARI